MMATSKKGKKVINQDELRRLMRAKQRQTTDKKRIESPFAKYNSLDHLSCVLCNVQVKSELLWQTHVLGKQHKEKVSELKDSKQPSSSSQTPRSSSLKRKPLEPDDINEKKGKSTSVGGHPVSGLPADFFGGKERASSSTQKSAGLRLLAGDYNEDEEDEQETKHAGTTSHIQQKGESAGLPADFFESSSIPSAPTVSHSGSILKADEPEKPAEKKENTAEALPEGFFDDPVRDAKVRKVDAPKDLLDKEWDEFQKEMRQVNTKSEAIVAEDDEEGRLERQIDEIDEQMECYRRVEVLRDKRDVVKSNSEKNQEPVASSEGSIEEEDEEELLHLLSRDWRAKGALA